MTGLLRARALEATAHALEANMPEEDDDALEAEESGFDEARARAAIDKRNKENQSLRLRLKELEPLAQKAREADEAAKSQAQKDAEARAAVERERDEARMELLRMNVAMAKGLTPELAARLRGNTEAELAKDADELLKLVKPPAAPSSSRPVADLRPGALPAGDSPQTFNADDWIRDRAHRRA